MSYAADLAEYVQARIELGSADYHESCCAYALSLVDESVTDDMPECDCRGDDLINFVTKIGFYLPPLLLALDHRAETGDAEPYFQARYDIDMALLDLAEHGCASDGGPK